MSDKKAGMFVLNRNLTLSSTMGHTVAFVKDEEVYVPPALRGEAQTIGALPVEGPEEIVEGDEIPDPMGLERDQVLQAAITTLREKNARGDFTASGAPTVAAMSAAVGFQVVAAEIQIQVQKLAEQAAVQAEADATGAG